MPDWQVTRACGRDPVPAASPTFATEVAAVEAHFGFGHS